MVEKPGRVRRDLPSGRHPAQDLDTNQVLYGKKLENRDIVKQDIAPPSAASSLLNMLNKYSSAEANS